MVVACIVRCPQLRERVARAVNKCRHQSTLVSDIESLIRFTPVSSNRAVLVTDIDSVFSSSATLAGIFSKINVFLFLICETGTSCGDPTCFTIAENSDMFSRSASDEELIARLSRALSWSRGGGSEQVVRTHIPLSSDLSLDVDRCRIVGRSEITLTDIETQILEALARSDGSTVERRLIYRRVWRLDPSPWDRKLDIRITALRRKLYSVSEGMLRIKTVRNVGYRLLCYN